MNWSWIWRLPEDRVRLTPEIRAGIIMGLGIGLGIGAWYQAGWWRVLGPLWIAPLLMFIGASMARRARQAQQERDKPDANSTIKTDTISAV